VVQVHICMGDVEAKSDFRDILPVYLYWLEGADYHCEVSSVDE
jgi:hypothetical protein